ncbi:hypothetical protein TCDM_00561 [Trypanosoma cruzi Dm28c]|uniref:CH-like domain-containing protein n=2 Tax=Trypanosoma cruzi TaxID=5693 RepID=V5BX11_TRYCR|nr:hypothetical protein TCDM_00561 [Trypanosoma cruzi Dm28c]PWV01387.1 hypothetical protein C4B63_4g467 [Trypanosoma cruzi]
MQREIIVWLQSLDLSHQVRHPQQDLSNGFTIAEIVSRYDRRVGMHSYVPGCSTECKRRNWKVLLRDLKRLGCGSVTAEMAEATIQGKPGVAAMVLDNLYEFFCNRPIPPRATDGSDGNKMSILNLLDALHEENTNHVAKTLERKPLPLRSMENDEIALGKGIKQPGFARPTAVSLLHVANRDTRNAVLAAAVPADELRVQQRNEKLLNEHNLLHKAYRYAEPQRFAPVDHRRLAAIGKKNGKSESVFKMPFQDDAISADKVSMVEVNMLSKRLLGALQFRESADNAKADSREKSREKATRKLLEACGHNLSLGLSKLLRTTLETSGFKELLGESSNGIDDKNILTFFVGHREEIPFAAAVACWSALLNASSAIASTLLIRPTEYMYILRAVRFICVPEMLQIPLLHVSVLPDMHNARSESIHTTSTLTHGFRSLLRSKDTSDAILSLTEDLNTPQQAVFSNKRIFHVASVFVFLCSIGKEVHAVSPQLAYSLLMNYFVPTISRIFCLSSAAILEAIARVVVAHICGDGSKSKRGESGGNATESGEEQQLQQSEKTEWNAALRLTSLLAGSLKAAFVGDEFTDSTNSGSKRAQYNLFLLHVLRIARESLGTDDLENEEPKSSTLAAQQEITITSGVSLSSMSLVSSPTTPVELCARGVMGSLGSSSMRERSIGVAMVLQFLAWDRWDLALEPFLFVLNDVKQRGASGSFLQRAADAWELRVFLLELLTITFRKALYVIAEESANVVWGESMVPSSTEKMMSPTVASVIRQKIDFVVLEEATVLCLEVFFEAPLLQRQLALQIVGARLLPDEQRNVAAMWLRGLFAFSVDQLDFLLRPHEAEPLCMQDPTCSTHLRIHSASSRFPGTLTSEFCGEKESEVYSMPPQQPGSVDSSKEAFSSVRILLGRVEPAYVVSPLNQLWDTFSVVQAALMFEDILTTAQVFSVVLAAVLSPQLREAQRLRLIQNLHAVGGLSASVTPIITDEDSAHGKVPLVANDDGGEKALDVTLRGLVVTYGQRGAVKNESGREVVSTRDNVVAPAGVNTSAHFVVENDERGEAYDEAKGDAKKKGKSQEEEEDPVTLLESHEKAFWTSVLRLLRAQLLESITNEQSFQQQRKKKKPLSISAPPGNSWASVCRVTKTDTPARMRELATAVLLTLYCRYGGVSTDLISKETSLCDACQWLTDL